MELNRDASGPGLQSEINITPLVDVVLVLLIIFMVVVPLLMQGYDVDIPRSSADASPAQSAEARLILTITPTTCRILEPPAGEGLK
jgi:biopolymer transport protein ExbD